MTGVALGRAIRKHGLDTDVGSTLLGADPNFPKLAEQVEGYCVSACSYAFFGGVERYVGAGELGVHQFRSVGAEGINSSEAQTVVGLLMLYAVEMGIEPEAIIAANLMEPSGIYIFSDSELQGYNINNTIGFIEPEWAVVPQGRGMILSKNLELGVNRRVSVRLFCVGDPKTAKLLISEYYDANKLAISLPLISFRDGASSKQKVGMNFDQPFVSISGVSYGLQIGDVDFQDLSDGWAAISLNIPKSLLSESAEAQISFDPRFPRVYWPLLFVSMQIPSVELLNLMSYNCI